MKVEKFNYNDRDDLFANTYVVSDSLNNAVIIDPSVDYDGIINYLERNSLTPKAILLTHGHFDHIRGVSRLINKYNIPVYIHFLETPLLTDPYLNGSELFGNSVSLSNIATLITITDKQVLKILENEIIVIHTPYHTEGSVCYYIKKDNILFTGDTLFKLSVGRNDLPTSTSKYTESTFDKLKALPEATKVYPGHEGNTTIGFELSFNRFLNY